MASEQRTRLSRYLAMAGVASRRAAEDLIAQGRVAVNGQVVTEQGSKVTSADRVEVDRKPVAVTDPFVYVLLYKPVRVMTTVHDPQGRPTVMDCVRTVPERIFPVGRLDFDTAGALLLTNDGDLAHRLMHPATGVAKVYEAVVAGRLSAAGVAQLESGIELDGRLTAPAQVRIHGTDGTATRVRIVLQEGRNRQVRRMLESVGCACVRLTRVAYGPLTLSALRPGQFRLLSTAEVTQLRAVTTAKPVQHGGVRQRRSHLS
ncbi:MAG: pseudouridine synthase [Firmicutes bacterium]|nr:pseudouridine synthase [Bacillota bacterium]